MYHISISYTLWNIIIITRIVHLGIAGTYNSLHIEVVSITVVPYYTVITRDVPVERDCNTITVLLLLLFQINNQSINQSPIANAAFSDGPMHLTVMRVTLPRMSGDPLSGFHKTMQ